MPPATHDDDARYLALKARDARFDGHFFTGVTSTGIYCRPVCRVRTPKRENCRFFVLAAQAEAAGYRPCLRCRPELAPATTAALAGALAGLSTAVWSTQDASRIQAQQAAHLLDGKALSAGALAQAMGLSERHVRRIFEAHWGITPLQYLQTRRLLAAKQWLTDTSLGMAQVARLSGFASVRRFNAAFVAHYRLQPSALRKATAPRRRQQDIPGAPLGANTRQHSVLLKASYRPPYDVAAMLNFFAARSLHSVECVDVAGLTIARTLSLPHKGAALHGWVHCQFVPGSHRVELQIGAALAPVLPVVLARLREMLDLDADPAAIEASVGPHFPGLAGLRVPGTVDAFELAVRAVLGQQVTVAAGRTLAQRLVTHFGTPVQTPWPQLNRSFPCAQVLAQAPGEVLGALGIVRQRQRAIHALAHAVACGDLLLSPSADTTATLAALQALPGIGPWTAQYIAMRALRWPDALVAGDVALHHALGLRAPHCATPSSPTQRARETERIAAAWRPFRSYAVVRAWHASNSPPPSPPTSPAQPALATQPATRPGGPSTSHNTRCAPCIRP
jgi:AraC family transcriptional regulator of adaptative response / DNA-3-methyladenine glycosylase II